MPTAAVRLVAPAENITIEDVAGNPHDLLDRGPLTDPPPEIESVTYDFDETEGFMQTVRVTTTTSAAGSSEEVQNWARVTAMKLMQDRVYRAWTTTGTSTSATIDLWPISTSATGNWIADQCTAASSAVWRMESWQDCKHVSAKWERAKAVRETPEQVAERAAKAELARQAAAIEAAKVKVFTDTAKARARRLLISMLTPDQRKELEEKNHFHLTVHDRSGSMRVYRIEHGYAGNVKLLGVAGQPVKRYCIHADYRLPYEDQMLAQKLLLESNEEHFLKVANMTQLRAA